MGVWGGSGGVGQRWGGTVGSVMVRRRDCSLSEG